MKFKPRKSGSMVIRNGKVTSKFQLQLQGEIIPSIEENSIKCLGKWYEASLTDKSNASRTEKQADKWLRKTEGSGLPGKFKAWLFQHGLLPRLMWLLIIYEVPMTSVEGVERRVNENLCRWLRIPPSFTSVGLKIRSGQLQLLRSSVVKEFKVAKWRAVMMYRDSSDEKVRDAGIITRSGCKWAADTSVAQAESMLKLKDIIGNPCMGRQGLRTNHFQQWGKADTRQRRGWGPTPGRRKAKVKGRGTWITRSLDKVGPAKEKNHVSWTLETRALSHLFPAPISVRHSSNTNKPAQVGTYWWGAILHLARGDIDGVTTRSSGWHIGAGETEKAPDPCETNLIYPVHQGGREAP